MYLDKTNPKIEVCNNLSFDIGKKLNYRTENSQGSISNNFSYNFNYGYVPSLENYELNIKNYSPMNFKGTNKSFTTSSNIQEIESIYENIKKDFIEIKP